MDREPQKPKIVIRRSSEPVIPNSDGNTSGITPDIVPPQRPAIRVSRFSSPSIRPVSPSPQSPPVAEHGMQEPTPISTPEHQAIDAVPQVTSIETSEINPNSRNTQITETTPRVKRHVLSERERRLFPEPPREGVVMSPQMNAVSAIIGKLGFVPENIESIIPKFVRAQNALIDQVRNNGDESQAIRLEDEFLEGMREAKSSDPNPNKTFELVRGASGIITLANVANGLTILDNPPHTRVVVEKTPNGLPGSDAVTQNYEERESINNLRNEERRRPSRLQEGSYFPEIRPMERVLRNPERVMRGFEMPFFPPEMNVTVMAQQARLSRRQLREVMTKHAEVIDIVVGAGGWLEDKIESIYLLPNDRYVVLDHDQTFQFRGQRVRASGLSPSEFNEIYPPSERTRKSAAEALKRFTEVAGIIKDQSLKDKLTVMYHRLLDDSEPPMTPNVFSTVISNIDSIGVNDLIERTLTDIASDVTV